MNPGDGVSGSFFEPLTPSLGLILFIEHVWLALGFEGLDVGLPGGFDLLGGVAGDDLLAQVVRAA